MSRRAARLLAGSILALSVAMLAASIPIASAARARTQPGQIVVVGDPTAPGMQAVRRELEQKVVRGDDLISKPSSGAMAAFAIFSFLWLATGTLIVGRQPRNFAGWIFITVGVAAPLLVFCSSLVTLGVKARPGSLPGVGAAALVGEHALTVTALVPLLFLWYPDGRPPSARWKWASRSLFLGVAIASVGFVLKPGPLNNFVDDGILYENPVGIPAFGAAGAVTAAGTVLSFAGLFATVVAVIVRFRRSEGEERQQMRLLAFVAGTAGSFLLVLLVGGAIAELLAAGSTEKNTVFDLFFAVPIIVLAFGIPSAYLIAIFRYRLFDIDVVIKKTVVFGLLAAFLSGIYAAVVAGIGALVGSRSNAWLSFLAAAVLALLFQPARNRARRLAGRLVYGRRATPYEVLAEFSERMGETYATEDVLARMGRLLGESTGATSARVWLRVGSELRVEAGWPRATDAGTPLVVRGDAMPAFPTGEQAFEVRHQGELLGALSVTMPASDPMNPAKAKLVSDLAAQAGLVLRNVRLIEELRESRRRVVTAQDVRAKALERNIHDGAQQQLVALQVKLGLARTMSKPLPKVEELLGQLQIETQEALEELRDLVRGIYPPLLADQGLVAALQAQARKSSVPVEVYADGVGRYPQEAEAAVYFSVLEALQNVAKYAQATRATVRLSSSNGVLSFEVADDGKGFDLATISHGTGLQGIADRLEALGGGIAVSSKLGEGTRISGRVPIGPHPEVARAEAAP